MSNHRSNDDKAQRVIYLHVLVASCICILSSQNCCQKVIFPKSMIYLARPVQLEGCYYYPGRDRMGQTKIRDEGVWSCARGFWRLLHEGNIPRCIRVSWTVGSRSVYNPYSGVTNNQSESKLHYYLYHHLWCEWHDVIIILCALLISL